jgi:pyrroline-5-carboxylate reductase
LSAEFGSGVERRVWEGAMASFLEVGSLCTVEKKRFMAVGVTSSPSPALRAEAAALLKEGGRGMGMSL